MIRVVNRAFLVALLGIALLCTTHVMTANAQTASQVTITKSLPAGSTVDTTTKKVVGENINQTSTGTTGLKYVEKYSEIINGITPETSIEKGPVIRR